MHIQPLEMTLNSVNFFKNTLVKAYFYIVHADGKIDAKEVALGKKMIAKEKIDEKVFDEKMTALGKLDQSVVIKGLQEDLRKLSKKDQIKVLAYMSNIANADGFMDPTEWKMIYKLYKEELNLKLEDILAEQKQIPPFTS